MEATELFRRWAAPRGVAVVGASADPSTIGGKPLVYLRRHGYAGRVWPVNPKYPSVQGLKAYPDIESVPDPVDVAVIAVGAARVPEMLERTAARGIPLAVVFSSGFAETGPEGAALQAEVTAIARRTGIRVLGPNCQGYAAFPAGAAVGFSMALEERGPVGDLALVSQSGALGFSLFNQLLERQEAFRYVTSTGNEADLTVADVLGWYGADPEVGRIMVYLEGVRRPEAFYGALEEARRRGVPVVVLKGGRTAVGRTAARAHTGADAGDYDAFRTAMREVGAILVEDVEEAADVLAVLRATPPPRAAGVGVVSTSGGAGVLLADGLLAQGFDVPALAPATRARLKEVIPPFGSPDNPVDVTAQVIGDTAAVREALGAVADDPGVAVLAVALTMVTGITATRLVDVLLELKSRVAKPVVLLWTASRRVTGPEEERLAAAGIPLLRSPGALARALGHWYRWHWAHHNHHAGPGGPGTP
ncbi:MAG: CoA-binding protein [Actinomycetia bacterium]|nr:CoA-binding protein [Actinomycetes bacterium]